MSNLPQNGESQTDTADPRPPHRRRVTSLAYVDLDGGNGGIILNIGEDGLQVAAAGPMETGPLRRMRFQFPGSKDWVETGGEVTWVSESRREVNIRFVELPEDARNRIKDWISAETSHVQPRSQIGKADEEKKEPSAPPPAPSLTSPPADVASLRANPEEETHGVTSRLESEFAPQETEALTPGPVPDEREFPPETKPHPWDAVVDSDRRQLERRRFLSLAYVDLGGTNGGIILNLSEGGLVVAVAAPVQKGPLPKLRFQLPGSNDWVETSGETAWVSNSRREVGIRFVDLSPDNREKIKAWVASEQLPAEPQAQRAKEPPRRRVLEMPDLRPSRSTPVQPPRSEPIIQVRTPMSVLNARVAATLEGATVRVGVPSTHVSGPRQTAEKAIKPDMAAFEPPPRLVVPIRNWWSIAAMVVGVATLSFLVGWFAAGRATRNRMFAALKGSPVESTQPAAAEKPAPVENAAAAPTIPPSNTQSQEPSAKPPSPSASVNVTGPPTNIVPAKTQASKPAIAIAPVARPNPQPPNATKKPKTEFSATHAGGSVPSSQAVTPPPQNPIAISAPPKEVAAVTPTPNASQPELARPIVTNSAAASPPPKPAENPDVFKGSVSVSVSPYPSIRIPTELRSQMAKQGASLQMGQLVSRVDPAYPEDAEKRHIEGTVKLHVIIGRDGAVESAALVGGPEPLASAATSAVKQWRYKPASVGGQPVEAEQDVTVAFRLVKQAPQSK